MSGSQIEYPRLCRGEGVIRTGHDDADRRQLSTAQRDASIEHREDQPSDSSPGQEPAAGRNASAEDVSVESKFTGGWSQSILYESLQAYQAAAWKVENPLLLDERSSVTISDKEGMDGETPENGVSLAGAKQGDSLLKSPAITGGTSSSLSNALLYQYYSGTPQGQAILNREQAYYTSATHNLTSTDAQAYRDLFIARVRYNRGEGGV